MEGIKVILLVMFISLISLYLLDNLYQQFVFYTSSLSNKVGEYVSNTLDTMLNNATAIEANTSTALEIALYPVSFFISVIIVGGLIYALMKTLINML
ncbi:MAG: hypothetical protein B6U94_03620 [Thermofilum sp. ex4484_79]|nr:MAG: hypothetical protein B6U94_03620 [Thermofilum sp. ex4484_79]